MIPDVRPSFFKIIASNHNHDKLRVPPHFRKYVSMEMFDRAILRGASGNHCQVKLQKRLKGIYLEDGWQQFMRDHSLGDHELLIFTYAGDMCFDVQIFEKSGCERVDASSSRNHLGSASPPSDERKRGKPKNVQPDSSHLDPNPPESNLGKLSDSKKSKEKKKVHVKIETDGMDFTIGGVDAQANKSEEKSIKRETMEVRDLPAQEIKRHSWWRKQCLSEESTKALRMAEAFSSRHPHFWSCMKAYNTSRSFIIRIPISFAKLHIPQRKAMFTLRNSEGKTWDVKTTYSGKCYFFSAGWTSFSKYNKVKDGDVCLFELVDTNLVQVHIFRTQKRS